MNTKGYLRPATLDDAIWIAPRLRPADRRECLAASGMPPEVALPAAIQGASAAFSVCWGPHPAALLWFNDVYGQPDIGVVSMVATEELEEHSIEFLRRGRELLPSFFTRYQILTNHVDERNQLHIKWLRWLGFSLLRRTTSWSVDGTPFIEFARLAPCA